jgi:hypothetical protein
VKRGQLKGWEVIVELDAAPWENLEWDRAIGSSSMGFSKWNSGEYCDVARPASKEACFEKLFSTSDCIEGVVVKDGSLGLRVAVSCCFISVTAGRIARLTRGKMNAPAANNKCPQMAATMTRCRIAAEYFFSKFRLTKVREQIRTEATINVSD